MFKLFNHIILFVFSCITFKEDFDWTSTLTDPAWLPHHAETKLHAWTCQQILWLLQLEMQLANVAEQLVSCCDVALRRPAGRPTVPLNLGSGSCSMGADSHHASTIGVDPTNTGSRTTCFHRAHKGTKWYEEVWGFVHPVGVLWPATSCMPGFPPGERDTRTRTPIFCKSRIGPEHSSGTARQTCDHDGTSLQHACETEWTKPLPQT